MVLKILVKAFKREVAFLPSKWAIPTILRGLKFFQLHLRSETFQKVVCGVIPLVHYHLNIFSRKFWKTYILWKFDHFQPCLRFGPLFPDFSGATFAFAPSSFFTPVQLLESLRKNIINKQKTGVLTYYFWRKNLIYWRA